MYPTIIFMIALYLSIISIQFTILFIIGKNNEETTKVGVRAFLISILATLFWGWLYYLSH